MPPVLKPEAWLFWLGEQQAELLQLKVLLRPLLAGQRAHRQREE
jgi:hypothetical protein